MFFRNILNLILKNAKYFNVAIWLYVAMLYTAATALQIFFAGKILYTKKNYTLTYGYN